MKIKIDKNGALHIERAGVMNVQYCLHSPHVSRCGDWCPAFGEPKVVEDNGNTVAWLGLCEEAGFVSCSPEYFFDERGHDNDQT